MNHTDPLTNPPTAVPPRLALGASGEVLAADHLVAGGMAVLARNWRIADGDLRGELDLVLQDGDVLVVVEVKTRRSRRHGSPLEAVTPRKQAQVRRLTSAFLRETGIRARAIRFDVVGVLVEREATTISHLRGAF